MSLDIEIICEEVGSIRKLPSNKISLQLYNVEDLLRDISSSYLIDHSTKEQINELLEDMHLQDIILFLERKGFTVIDEGG